MLSSTEIYYYADDAVLLSIVPERSENMIKSAKASR